MRPNEFDILLEHTGRILSNIIRNAGLRREMRTEDADVRVSGEWGMMTPRKWGRTIRTESQQD